jgi:membrane protease YdiL (CAAX protease family)
MDEQPSNTPEKEATPAIKVSAGPFGVVAIMLFIFFGAEQIATLFLLQVYPRIRSWNSNQTNKWLQSFSVEFWMIAICYPMILFFLWRFFLKGKDSVRKLIGLVRPKIKNIGWVVVGLLLFYVVTSIVLAILVQLSPSLKANSALTQQLNVASVHGTREILAAILGLSIIDPITEEIVFRGFIFSSLKGRYSVIIASLITSVIFAVPHMLENSSSILYTVGIAIFCLSLILCYVRQKTGNLYAGMLIHSCVNAVSLIALINTH